MSSNLGEEGGVVQMLEMDWGCCDGVKRKRGIIPFFKKFDLLKSILSHSRLY